MIEHEQADSNTNLDCSPRLVEGNFSYAKTSPAPPDSNLFCSGHFPTIRCEIDHSIETSFASGEGHALSKRSANGLSASGEERASRGRTILLGAIILAVTAAAYIPAMNAGFVWDDDILLLHNPLIKADDGLYRLWFTKEPLDYFPLWSSTWWVEWRLWGAEPAPYHVVNIVLHAASAVLVWRVLQRLKIPGAFFAGLLFGVHPVTVASVAWISERKNTLSMLLYLLAILGYLRFEDDNKRRWYAAAIVAFIAALLAKTSVVMLPFVLLLLAWRRRGRIQRKDVVRTVPFFAASLVLGLVTVWYQYGRAIGGATVRPEGWLSRVAATGWIVWFYLCKLVAPVRLAPIYPRWNVDGASMMSFLPLVVLLACVALLWVHRKRLGRAPLCALGYFLLTLAPVLGLLDMSFMRHSFVADHLQYVPLIGIIALFAAAAATCASRLTTQRTTQCVAAAALVAGLAMMTWRQAEYYKDEGTFWTRCIALNSKAWGAYSSRGDFHASRKEFARAIRDYDRTIELRPGYAEVYNNRGNVRFELEQFARAIQDYTKAIELKPQYAMAYSNRSEAHFRAKAYDKAWADVRASQNLGGTPSPAFLEALRRASGRDGLRQ